MVAGAAVGTLGVVYLLWRTIARHPAFWAVGAVAVFWFSVSGVRVCVCVCVCVCASVRQVMY